MGCDGGSIPRRDELVKMKKKEEKPDPNEVERIKWSSCAISKEPLKDPIVADELGFLYNKEAVIRHLLDKTMDESFKHVRSLKDLIPVHFTPNPAFEEKKGDENNVPPFICPIILVEVGRHRFSLLKTCGCVLSEKAFIEVPSATCLQCGKPFQQSDILPLNPPAEELEGLKKVMKDRREQEKQEARSKKEKKRADKKASSKADALAGEVTDKLDAPDESAKLKRKVERDGKKRALDITATTASAEPAVKKTTAYASIFTSSIKSDPNARVETFMCRNVLRS